MGADAIFFTLKDCTTSSTLGAGAGGLVISGGKIFYSDSLVTLEKMIKFASKAELYFSAKCDQYY